jgi:sugar lactone lactonase YvrE
LPRNREREVHVKITRPPTPVVVALALVAVTVSVAYVAGSTRRAGATAHHRPVTTPDAIAASPPTWGTFARPGFSELAFGPDGSLYTTDCGNARVYRIGPKGHTSVFAGAGPGGYQQWVKVDGGRNTSRPAIWVAVGSYGGDGRHPTDALFNCTVGLAFDAAGDLFISDHGNSRIREIDTDGFVSTVAGVGPGVHTHLMGPGSGDGGPAVQGILDHPWGIAFDGSGNLYIADRDHDAVRMIDTNGTLTTVAGTGRHGFNGDGIDATTAKLDRPIEVALDASDRLYITDEDNHRVRMVNHAGIISTLVGDGRYGCGGDGGPAVDASLRNPGDLVFMPDGSLLVSDGECHRIRRVATDGTITTFAGNGRAGCGGVGGPIAEMQIGGDVGLAYGPDGDLYISNCHRIVRVDDTGTTHLVARAPTLEQIR